MINVSNWKKDTSICYSCQTSKSCKLPFNTHNELSLYPLNKIHYNLWAPAPVISCQGFKYYASFVDDCSRFAWIYPSGKKSNLLSYFAKFHKLVESQFDKKIKVLQTDRGGEFVSLKLKTIL